MKVWVDINDVKPEARPRVLAAVKSEQDANLKKMFSDLAEKCREHQATCDYYARKRADSWIRTSV